MQERYPFQTLLFFPLDPHDHRDDLIAVEHANVVFLIDVGHQFLLVVEKEPGTFWQLNQQLAILDETIYLVLSKI